jgi:16S rRNA (adenine1518-N6/adenine1519-N6)-dimethyltransferase
MTTARGGSGVVPGAHRRLTSPATVQELLAGGGLHPRHGFGQNFLIDANVLRVITEAAGLEAYDTVVEVGPGLGALTQALAEQGGRVYAIEADARLLELLSRELGYLINLVLINSDALAFDLADLWPAGPPEGVKMISNLPYQIAATLLVGWLRKYEWLADYTVMVQREVADRLAASCGGRDYSAGSVKVQYRASVRRVASVSRNSFYPKPRVDSAIVRIERRPSGSERGLPEAADEDFFDRLVSAAFHQRRKKLVNSVASRLADVDRARLVEGLGQIGKDEGARAEELSPADFARLANILAPVPPASRRPR